MSRLADHLQVTTLEQRCQKLESEVQKLAQTWSEAAPAEEIKVSHDAEARPTCCLAALPAKLSKLIINPQNLHCVFGMGTPVPRLLLDYAVRMTAAVNTVLFIAMQSVASVRCHCAAFPVHSCGQMM